MTENNMKKIFNSFFLLSIASLISIFILHSCANIARPGGGPFDEEPPIFLNSKPYPNQVNVYPKKIELHFVDNIKLDNPFTKVIVSPPQKTAPIIKSNAKTVTIELKDSLKANTTYTIDFTDAVRDNNEGNILNNFSIAFSTGNVIDSLKISGTLLSAENLEPQSGIIVGIHSDLSDSAFVSKPFERIGKSDEQGRFNIYNITPGTYKVYALKDINSNYMFDLPGEDIAFLDSLIVPNVEIMMHNDTVFSLNKSSRSAKKLADNMNVGLSTDSVRRIPVPHYYPDNLVLRTFNENKKTLYLEKSERESPEKLNIYFSAPQDSTVILTPINFDDTDWAVIENSKKNDTLHVWVKDSMIFKIDTLKFAVTHQYTDTLKQLSIKTDTINFVQRNKAQAEKKSEKSKSKKNKDEEISADSVKIEFISFKDNISSSMDIGVRPKLTLPVPIADIDKEMFHVMQKVDTLFVDQEFEIRPSKDNEREFEIRTKLSPGESYRITIDSAAVNNIYGLHNNLYNKSFTVKKVEDYSSLVFDITGVEGDAFVEVLNSSDKPVAKATVKDGQAKFPHLKPGTYYARIVLDKNNNGVYDTGDYALGIQPDEVYYYNMPIELKEFWRVKQDWNINSLPLTKQKPLEITKNKPKEVKSKNRNEQYQNKKSSGNSYGGGTISGGPIKT